MIEFPGGEETYPDGTPLRYESIVYAENLQSVKTGDANSARVSSVRSQYDDLLARYDAYLTTDGISVLIAVLAALLTAFVFNRGKDTYSVSF